MSKEKLKERLRKRRETLNEKGGNQHFHYLKAGDTRLRIVTDLEDEDADWAKELITFYVNGATVLSPMTNGEPCALMAWHEKMKKSKSEAERDLSTKLRPKKKWAVAALKYADSKGKEADQGGVRIVMVSTDVYSQLTDLYLDDENGDFTDPVNGYDVKIKREGTGQFDTTYSVMPCRPTKLPKEYRKGNSIEELVKNAIATHEETELELEKFLSGTADSDDEKTVVKKKKKKKKVSDA